jgi:hypothetical protein
MQQIPAKLAYLALLERSLEKAEPFVHRPFDKGRCITLQ